MPDLTPEEVRVQLAAQGLAAVDDDDLIEVTHRINALREALQALEVLGLDEAEELTVFGQVTSP